MLAGVDFTLRDGRVEDAACPVDFQEQSRSVQRVSDIDRTVDYPCPPPLNEDPNKAIVATQNFQDRTLCIGDKTILFEKEVMIKTLERHHSEFYSRQGGITSFFPHNPSVEDIFRSLSKFLIRINLKSESYPQKDFGLR
ncbi:MAG: hypothetical protein HC921_21685 [Synechococcaceae cyanobacterium SM2_3_1]|nr:hypothetical protein [Synechococcaceae cyanobacterium SM2_3_1]